MAETLEALLKEIYDIHDIACNQTYGGDLKLPYSFHLKAVVAQVRKYAQGHQKHNHNLILAAAGHDLIEDARMTYNDLVVSYGTAVADVIYCCTEEKGKNRTERHSDKFFTELTKNRNAVFVKLCDILANIIFSKLMDSSMYAKYQKEFPKLEKQLYIQGEYQQVWENLRRELNLI